MDLREVWKKLDQEKLSQPIQDIHPNKRLSKHPVTKLIQSFQIGLGFIVVFEALFVYLFFIFAQPIVKLGIGVIIILYILFFIMNYRTLKRISRQNKLDQNLKETLTNIHTVAQNTLSFQLKISWAVFPLCVTAGFLVGLSLKADAATMLVKPVIYLTLIGTTIVVTPLCYWLTNAMTKISYGKYLRQLEELIQQLKEDKV